MRLDEHYVGGARVWCDRHQLQSVERIDGRVGADGRQVYPHRYVVTLDGAWGQLRLTLDEDQLTLLADNRGLTLYAGHAVTLSRETAADVRQAAEMLGVRHWALAEAYLDACAEDQRRYGT